MQTASDSIIKEITQAGKRTWHVLGGREGLSLRSLWNDEEELASGQLREKQPGGPSFFPKLNPAPVQGYFKGKQVQDSEAPTFIIQAFRARMD